MKKFGELITEKSQEYRYNQLIDYTYLKNDISIDMVKEICDNAKKYNFYSVCVKPNYITYVKQFLKDTNIKVCTVISFPHGVDKIKSKISEIEESIINGVDEIDVVMNYKLLKKTTNIIDEEKYNKNIEIIKNEISTISRLCHGVNSIILKVIIETSDLTLEQIKLSCDICVESGVDYIMTSTGMSKYGADIEKVRFMRKILPDSVKIKASGGIRTIEDINKFVKVGSDRIGTSVIPYQLR